MLRSPRPPGRRTASLCSPTTSSPCRRKQVLLYLSSQILYLKYKSLGVRTMLLHCAKPGDSGTYRITITNSSGTASCSASLSVRSESQIFFLSVDIITKIQLDVPGKTTSYTPTPTASHLSVPRSPYSSLGRSSSTSYSSSSNASYSSSYSPYNSSYSSGRGTTPYSSYRSYL